MYKYIKAYNYGYEEGIKKARNDFYNKKAKYKKIKNNYEPLIYDIGYIEGYNKMLFFLKNNISIRSNL